MGVTQYIGSRYVPVFAEPSEWNSTRTYEPLTIVTHEGASYTSKQSVPAGVKLTDERYWAPTGNYNAQVESYRKEVGKFSDRIQANTDSIARMANSNGKRMALNPIGRTVLNDTSYYQEGYTAIQAGCYLDSYYYVALINAKVNNAYVLKVSMTSGGIEDAILVRNAGHMNGACVYGRKVVFLPAFDTGGDRFDVIIYDVDTNSITRRNITGLPNARQVFAIGYDGAVNKFYAMVSNDTNIYELSEDFEFEREIFVKHSMNYKTRVNRNGGSVHNGLFYTIHGNETLLACYSLTDGKVTKVYNIGEYQGSTFTGEIECLNFVSDDTMYLVAGIYYPKTYTAIQFFQASINNDGITSMHTDLRTEFTSTYTYHVNQNARTFNPTGGKYFPFTYIAEALIAARANKNNVTDITVDGVDTSRSEYIYILKSDVNLYLNRANVQSLHATNSTFYISQANVTGSHYVNVRGNPHDVTNCSAYFKQSNGVLNDTRLLVTDKPTKYASLYVDENSTVMYLNKAIDSDINDSDDIHVYGTYITYKRMAQPRTAIPTIYTTDHKLTKGGTFTVGIARRMICRVSIPGKSANKGVLTITPKISNTDNCVLISDGTNAIIVSLDYRFNDDSTITVTYNNAYKLTPTLTRMNDSAPEILVSTVFQNN